MAGEYLYNLQNLTRQHKKTTVLDDVTLSFFFGAKIGLIGETGRKNPLCCALWRAWTKTIWVGCKSPSVRASAISNRSRSSTTKNGDGKRDGGGWRKL